MSQPTSGSLRGAVELIEQQLNLAAEQGRLATEQGMLATEQGRLGTEQGMLANVVDVNLDRVKQLEEDVNSYTQKLDSLEARIVALEKAIASRAAGARG